MPRITILLDDEEIKLLNKRSKGNLFTLKEQIEDIVRRSCISFSKKKNTRGIKVDDKLVGIFSRQRTGPKKKKKVKKK